MTTEESEGADGGQYKGGKLIGCGPHDFWYIDSIEMWEYILGKKIFLE